MRKKTFKSKATSLALISSLMVAPMQGMTVFAEKGEASPIAVNRFDSSYDSQNAYSGDDLGCTYTKEKTTFKVWSPLATSVTLCRYATGSDGESGAKSLGTVEMKKGDKGVWSCTVDGDIVNTYYTYKVTANGKTKEAVDIYAKAAGVNGDRAMVVDLDSTDPDNWDKDYHREKTQLSDINVWEVHIRDFSIDVSSGVSEENRGKYKAFTEHTTVNGKGKVASCVDYLKELGVTHVQLLPMYDYGSTDSGSYCVDERNVSTSLSSNYNWGYDPENYNVPEGSYSSNPYDGNVRITEMKEMIQALHDAGIKVIMDVVYNHTYDTADSNFNKIMPDYYYKLNGDGSYNNQSGCGNATRSQSAMFRKYMIDSVSYWAGEYNLDGFRFDLMGIHDVTTMNQIRSALDKKYGEDTIVMYGEGWTATSPESDGAWKGNESTLDDGIGFFNDQIRDSIKGDKEYNGTIGYVQTNYQSGSYLEPGQKWPNNLFGGIMGSVGESTGEWKMWRPFWSKSSNCSLNYTSAHDDLTLWDKFFQTGKESHSNDFDSTADSYIRMNKMSGAIINISKGGTFMQAGEEFCRSKYGVKNSYSSPDSVNKLDWTRLLTHGTVADYYKGMLQIRHGFSGFEKITTRNGDNWNPNGNNYTWVSKDENGVSTLIVTNDTANEWNKVAVIMNNKTTASSVDLGKYGSSWVVISDGNTAGIEAISECGSNVTAAGKSVVVAVPKDTYDKNIEAVRKKLEERQNTNVAPAISIDTDSTIEVNPDSQVTIQVSAKDADGDKVTLSASGVPEGAEFDEVTGKFTWEKAVAGTYKVTFTADDGTDKTTKTVTIVVTSPTNALKDLVDEIEGAGLKEAEFTEDVWKNLQTALTDAKAVMEKDAPTEAECSLAVIALKVAYTAVTNEKAEREELATAVTSAETAIKNVDKSVDAELVADAKYVLGEAETLLEGVAIAKAYRYAKENLEDSVNALVPVVTTPQVHVSTSFKTPYIYIWTGSGTTANKIAGEWPGTQLVDKDSDNNYVYDLPDDGKYNIIINNGKTSKQQTPDLVNLSGDVTIKVAETSNGTDKDNNAIFQADTDCKPVSTGTLEVKKESLQNAITEAKEYSAEYYTEESFDALQKAIETAELAAADKDASQIAVNGETRALRKAILALVVKENVILPSETPIVSGTPDVTNPPTVTPEVEVTNTPEVTGTPDVPGATATATAPAQNTATPEATTEAPEPTATTDVNTGNDTPKPSSSVEPSKVPDSSATPTVVPTATAEPGKATEIPEIPAELNIRSLTFSPTLYQVVKKTIKLTVKAEGGKKNYSYKYSIYNASGKLVASKDYSSKNYCTWKTTKSGTYKFKVTVKDAEGKEKSKSKSIVVVDKKLTAVSLKASKYTIKKGKTLSFKAKATGGKKAYLYKFEVLNTKGKTVRSSNYIKNSVWKWKATKIGTYKIKVTVKDSLGVKATKTIKKIRVVK